MSNFAGYAKNATTTLFTSGFSALIGLGTSMLVARLLGPDGRGVFALAVLLPTLIISFTNFGIASATTYYTARKIEQPSMIAGNTIIASLLVSLFSIGIGFIVTIFFRESFFHGVSYTYLLVALLLVPPTVLVANLQGILLGIQSFNRYNVVNLIQAFLLFGLTALFLLVFRAGIYGALWANILALLLTSIIINKWVWSHLGKPSWLLNKSYLKNAFTYGLQAHLSNILAYLGYRVDMFLVNLFLNPVAVGLYAVGVALVEQIWMVSQAASTILFPMVSGSGSTKAIKDFTPLVSRTILVLNIIIAVAFFFLSKWIILILYGKAYLPAASTMQALLTGIVALGTGRVLANDIAGRGKPMLNTYINIVSVLVNVVLNILWIPGFGIVGAAWASTVSYTVAMIGEVFVYVRVSGNSWLKVLFIQRSDLSLYLQLLTRALRYGKNLSTGRQSL